MSYTWAGNFEAPGHGSYVIQEDERELEPGEVCELLNKRKEQLEDILSVIENSPLYDGVGTAYRTRQQLLQAIAEKVSSISSQPVVY